MRYKLIIKESALQTIHRQLIIYCQCHCPTNIESHTILIKISKYCYIMLQINILMMWLGLGQFKQYYNRRWKPIQTIVKYCCFSSFWLDQFLTSFLLVREFKDRLVTFWTSLISSQASYFQRSPGLPTFPFCTYSFLLIVCTSFIAISSQKSLKKGPCHFPASVLSFTTHSSVSFFLCPPKLLLCSIAHPLCPIFVFGSELLSVCFLHKLHFHPWSNHMPEGLHLFSWILLLLTCVFSLRCEFWLLIINIFHLVIFYFWAFIYIW